MATDIVSQHHVKPTLMFERPTEHSKHVTRHDFFFFLGSELDTTDEWVFLLFGVRDEYFLVTIGEQLSRRTVCRRPRNQPSSDSISHVWVVSASVMNRTFRFGLVNFQGWELSGSTTVRSVQAM